MRKAYHICAASATRTIRTMHWLYGHGMTVIIFVALVASFLVADETSQQRDRAQRTQLVRGCVRSSTRTAINAGFAFDAAIVRREAGDAGPAAQYAADGQALVNTIPAPPGFQGSRILAAINHSDGKATLTAAAKSLIVQGCEQAYP